MRKAILGPWIDLLCCGGLSIVVSAGLLLWFRFQPPAPELFSASLFFILSAAINFPHFMASYRLLYDSRERMDRHPWASLYIPALLVAVSLAGFAFGAADDPGLINQPTVTGLLAIAAVYLAWHYTGQAWGMTASFSWMAGVRYDTTERILIRGGCRLWLTWHVLWAITLVRGEVPPAWAAYVPGIVDPLYDVAYVAALLSFPFGAWGFLRAARRTGIMPPLRAIVPWVALYFWYALLHRDAAALVLLQLFHALQYLVFTARVDLNRYARERPPERRRPGLHLAFYYGTLLVMAGAVACVKLGTEGVDPQLTLFATVLACINIHHYFVDGVVWKIRHAEVRQDLFAHLEA